MAISVRAPSLLVIPECGPLIAAKLVGETAGVDRFHSKDAFARQNGAAPLPVCSSNRARRLALACREPSAQCRNSPHRTYSGPLSSRRG
ncbi:transposase [Rhodococcus sp. NPDC057014]|uniref:transposase n=1 Tax=Rhodococcus sp. NPDC057014 TaxID=3346000 RepID=UPI00362E6BF3